MVKIYEKSSKSAWFYVAIIIGIILLFIVISELIDNRNQNSDYSSRDTTQYLNKGTEIESQKAILITGQSNIQTIDNPNQIIVLTITGQYNEITVTKDTKISSVTITGQGNTVNLCNGIHSPQIVKTGQDNNIVYLSC